MLIVIYITVLISSDNSKSLLIISLKVGKQTTCLEGRYSQFIGSSCAPEGIMAAFLDPAHSEFVIQLLSQTMSDYVVL